MPEKASPNLLLLCLSLLTYGFFHLSCCYCSSTTSTTAREIDQPVVLNGAGTENHSNYKIKGMFVFGSSLVDNGNNNFLQESMAKADYSPYGIDFPLGPSGRFTNGKNVIDLLGDKLQLGYYIPPFTNPSTKGTKVVHGVNYASGGSGILDDTGSLAGQVISLSQQMRNFEEVTLPDLNAQLGCSSRESLPNYLFVVGSGGNDYSFNYFLRKSSRSNNDTTSLEAFTTTLITKLSSQLKRLYDMGGRKFVLMSLNPIGCTPMAMAKLAAMQPSKKNNKAGGCNQKLNKAAHLFNAHLKSLVDDIKPQMPASNLVYVNSYKVIRDIIRNPSSTGFSDASNPCCEVGTIGVLCKREGSTCANRARHVFFDGLHPTEAVNELIATKAYTSNLENEVYPINVEELVGI